MGLKSTEANLLPEARVVYPPFYYYGPYLQAFKQSLQPSQNWDIDEYTFKDGTPSLTVVFDKGGDLSETSLRALPRHQAIVPIWLSTQFNKSLPEIVWGVSEAVNALKRTERDRPPLVDKVIASCPYMELREDKDGGKGEDRTVGGPNIPQLYAKILGQPAGVDEMVLLGAHSAEAVASLREGGIHVLPVTATPLIAEHISRDMFKSETLGDAENAKRIDPKNARIVALDKGSLQQNILLCQQLGLDVGEALVAFDKTRKGQNMVADASLIYGSLQDLEGKDVIIYDDLIDTFGSMALTIQTLKDKCHCKSITIAATHGVLSYPARKNIVQGLMENGTIDHLITTDSLPKAKFLFEDLDGKVSIIETPAVMGAITQMLAQTSYEYMMSGESPFAAYIMDPLEKEEMWVRFQRDLAKPEKVQTLQS